MKEIVSQKPFLERLKIGEKAFSNIRIQFLDVHHLKLKDVVFENCDMNFCTFLNCDFRDVMFMDCFVYFGTFHTGIMDKTVFDRCRIEMSLFEGIQFSGSEMKRCDLRWNGILDSNISGINMRTSLHIKTITDISQVTQKDVEDAVSMVMKDIGRMDIEMRNKIREIMSKDIDRYGFNQPEEKKGEYGKGGKDYDNAPLTYGEMRQVVEAFFYGSSQPYKTKKAYETESKYKH
jgi:hypothetical protein